MVLGGFGGQAAQIKRNGCATSNEQRAGSTRTQEGSQAMRDFTTH